MRSLRAKRMFDVVAVLLTAPLWLPLMFLIALLVGWQLGRPVLFRQFRPGRDGVLFELMKFRSMTDARTSDGRLLSDADRLPAFGRRLRSTSLDELPELFNVLKGEMSLVGPRPLLVQYLDRYTREQRRRHDVLPGLTGWAQINGRNAISWEEKFALDIYYVENRTLWLDLKILWVTFWQVVSRRGVTAKGEATMSEFTGSRENSGPESRE